MLVVVVLVGSSHALALNEIKSDRVTVLYEDPLLVDYALHVIEQSEAALDVIIELFEFTPRHITISILENTDSFNGFATVTPHLRSGIYTTFPHEQFFSHRSDDVMYGLMIHELTHALQLTYAETKPSDEPIIASERRIFTGGDNAIIAPFWFIEGLATWIESAYALGGRLYDAQTQGLIQSLVLQGEVPSITDIGRVSIVNSEWPYGRAPYLLGASFIDYLVSEYGFDAIKRTLQVNNSRFSLQSAAFINFKSAWEEANGTNLEDEWLNWQQSILNIVQERTFTPTEALTDFGAYQNNPAISPDGTMVAWLDSALKQSGLKVATIGNTADGLTLNDAYLVLEKTPTSFSWLSNHELLYSRISPNAEKSFADVFLFDITTKTEKQLTFGSRLKEATYNPSNNCLLAYKDFEPKAAQLVEACFNQDTLSVERVWELEKGSHILDIAIDKKGTIALSIWKKGKADIVLFNPDTSSMQLLMNDIAQDLAPSWTENGTLLFHSDRHLDYDADEASLSASEVGVFELYELDIESSQLNRLTESLGGAFQPIQYKNGIIYSALDESGFRIAQLASKTTSKTIELSSTDATYPVKSLIFTTVDNSGMFTVIDAQEFENQLSSSGLQITTYQPLDSMSPWFWSPIFDYKTRVDIETDVEETGYTVGLGIMGQDITAHHIYMAEAAYSNSLQGHLDGSFANATYIYIDDLTRYSLRAGVWPHIGRGAMEETALGVYGSLSNTFPQDNFTIGSNLGVGLIHLQSHDDAILFEGNANFIIGNLRSDFWGYHQKGFDLVASARYTPYSDDGVNATSSSVFLGAYYAQSLEDLIGLDIGGYTDLHAQVVYSPLTADAPDTASPFSVLGHLGYHQSFDTNWGLGNTTFFIERMTIESKLRSWYDTALHIGGDIGIYADISLSYAPVFSMGFEVGYADGLTYGIKFRSGLLAPF